MLAACAFFALASCDEQSVIDPLQGIYKAPVRADLTEVLNSTASKVEGKRHFVLELATTGVTGKDGTYSGTGIALEAELIGSDYFLTANTYSAAEAAAAKKGNYVIGATNVYENGTVHKCTSGSIIITQSGTSYTMSAMLFCEDGSPYSLEWKGTLEYAPDPEAIKLSKVISAVSNAGYGTKSVTMSLASEDVSATYNPAIYSYVYSGTGYYLAIDLYSADGLLHEGTYTPSAVGGVIGEGQYGIGYDTEMWGQKFYNWGTCWWTVDNGATSAQKILKGDITVSRSGNVWTIMFNNDVAWAEFKGEIPALTGTEGGGDDDALKLSKCLAATSNLGNGVKSLTMQLASEEVSSTYDAATYTTTYSGTGYFLALDIYSADGKLSAGTYKACSVGGTVGEGEFGIGYDTSMWGMDFYNWGTCWWTVTDGATSAAKILDGTVEVAASGDDTYTVTLKSSVANAVFNGTITLKQ